ncbi:hypothetical protein BJV82DRAFT_659832 [Fennellomyces sp. T-0311]|nr:hypothetical protein BJV82DRAFT_659832 [Fennellomyces sp. T-0311]
MSEAPANIKKYNVSPIWKKSVQSKTRGLGKPTYLSIATVDAENAPLNELFLYRGFAGEDKDGETGWESDLLVSTCDKRTFKIADNATFVATWVVDDDNHFRIVGKAHALGQDVNSTDDITHHIARKKLSKILKGDGADGDSSSSEDEDIGDKISNATKSFLKRIKSRMHRHGKKKTFDWEDERMRQWHELSDDARASYAWPAASGQPKAAEQEELPRIESLAIGETDEEGYFKTVEDKDKQALLDQGYENFVVVFLEVLEIDHHAVSERQRTVYRKEGAEWAAVPVNA